MLTKLPIPYDLRRGPNFTLRDLVGAFSVITNLRMDLFEALVTNASAGPLSCQII